jgi:hypothetical protein
MTTRGEIKAKVLRLINKSSGYSGFHTDDHVNDALQDALDYIQAQQFMAGEGWCTTIGTLTTVAGTPTVALPSGCVIIDDLRYKIGDTYVSIPYDGADGKSQQANTSELVAFPTSWRLLQRNIYFNPLPSEVGADYIQIEYFGFSTALVNDSSALDSQFDRAMEAYIKWRTASMLMASSGKARRDWEQYEAEWYMAIKQIISKRVRQTAYVKDFDG